MQPIPDSFASYASTQAYATYVLVQNIPSVAERYPEDEIKPLRFFARRLEERRQLADENVLVKDELNAAKWPNLSGITIPVFRQTFRSPGEFFRRGPSNVQPKPLPQDAPLFFTEVIISETKLSELFPRMLELVNSHPAVVQVPDCVISIMAVVQRFIDTG